MAPHSGALQRSTMSASVPAAFCCCAVAALLLAGARPAAADGFSPPVLNDSYVSSVSFNSKGMGTLYDAARSFMRGIQKKDALPPGLLVVRDGKIAEAPDADFGMVARHYGGVIAVVVLGVLVALATPVIALCWCCCSCCCGGGGRSRGRQHEDHVDGYRDLEPSHKGSRRRRPRRERTPIIRPIILAALAGIALSGAIIALVANTYLNVGIQDFPDRLRGGISDIDLFVQNAVEEVNTTMYANYLELSGTLTETVQGGRNKADQLVTTVTESLPLEWFHGVVRGFEDINTDLETAKNTGDFIVFTSGTIVKGVQDVALSLKAKCPGTCPQPINDFIATIDKVQPFPVHDVSDCINAVKSFVDPSFEQQFENGVKQLNETKQQVNTQLDMVQSTITNTIKDTGDEIKRRSEDLQLNIKNASQVFSDADTSIQDANDKYLGTYNGYRYAAFIVFALILVVGAGAVAAGLLLSCCSKNSSFWTLKPGLWIISLTITILMLLTTAFFLVGLISDRVCEALQHPDDNQIINLVDQMIDQTDSDSTLPVHNASYYILACKDDQPLYQVLDLGARPELNIDQVLAYEKQFDEVFEGYLADMNKSVKDMLQIDVVPADILTQLQNLQTSAMATLDFDLFRKTIADGLGALAQVTPQSWSDQLKALGAQLSSINVDDEVSKLAALQTDVDKLAESATKLSELVNKLEEASKLGRTSFSDAIGYLLEEVKDGQITLQQTAPQLTEVADSTARAARQQIGGFLNHVVNRVKTEALRCGPLALVYDSTVSGVCDHMLQPWNGFWAGAGLSLIVLIPTSFLAATLT